MTSCLVHRDPLRLLPLIAGASALLMLLAAPAHSQGTQTFAACYVPPVGAVYFIRQPGLPQSCLSNRHVEITWREGATAGGAVGGDLTGSLPNPMVTALRGFPLSAAAPSSGQVLTWTGTAWAPAQPPSSGLQVGATAAGDLAGSYPAPSVVRLQGHPLLASSPSVGETLVWNGSAWTAARPPAPAIAESSDDRTVAPLGTISVTVSCPGGLTAMSAGWTTPGPAVVLTQSRRTADGSGWSFTWANSSPTDGADVRSTVYCGG